jgi:hypothetical protein
MPLDRARFLDALPRAERSPRSAHRARARAHEASRPIDPLPTLAAAHLHPRVQARAPTAATPSSLMHQHGQRHRSTSTAFDATLTIDPKARPSPRCSLDVRLRPLALQRPACRYFHSVTPRSGYRSSTLAPSPTTSTSTTASPPRSRTPIWENYGLAQHGPLLQRWRISAGQAPRRQLALDPVLHRARRRPRPGTLNLAHLGYALLQRRRFEHRRPRAPRAACVVPARPRSTAARGVGSHLHRCARSRLRDLRSTSRCRGPRHQTLALRSAAPPSPRAPTRATAHLRRRRLRPREQHAASTPSLSGLFDGAFVLRGYPARSYSRLERTSSRHARVPRAHREDRSRPRHAAGLLPPPHRRRPLHRLGRRLRALRVSTSIALFRERRARSTPRSSTPRSAPRSGSAPHARATYLNDAAPHRLRLRLQPRGPPARATLFRRLRRLLISAPPAPSDFVASDAFDPALAAARARAARTFPLPRGKLGPTLLLR